jgi:hypothetical protein
MPDAVPAANADEPKSDEPQGLIEKLGAALPVGLTALATVFASMSNGALQEAMYWKSQAAQDQARVTNQWTLAGFKRDRALVMQAAAAQLRAAGGYAPADFDTPAKPPKAAEHQKAAREWLTDGSQPPPVKLPELDDDIRALREAIKDREPDREILKKAGRVGMARISKAINDAEQASERTDAEWGPVLKAAAELVRARAASPGDPKAATAAQAAGFELEERRYRAESRANQAIGYLYEVRTKVSGAESDKYRRKSDYLSYAMLVAQVGAVASSLALARKRRSFLWLFAATVGVVAIGVGGYALLPPLLAGLG